MGQENEKVIFEGHQDSTAKRRHIFNRDGKGKPLEVCEIPGCNCILPHPQFDTKICSSCKESPPPFIKNRNRPKYYQEQYSPSRPEQRIPPPKQYAQMYEAESIPTKISYYNAWSLPSQKYQLKQRSDFNSARKSVDIPSNLSVSEEKRDNVDIFVQEVAERIKKAVETPKVELDRRKQNMNLSD